MDKEKRHQNISTNVVMPLLYKEMLKYLARHTRINQSEYLREAIAKLLRDYFRVFRGSEFEDEAYELVGNYGPTSQGSEVENGSWMFWEKDSLSGPENIATNVVIPLVHKEMLKYLARHTRINQSEYLREAIAKLLRDYFRAFAGSEFEVEACELGGKYNSIPQGGDVENYV